MMPRASRERRRAQQRVWHCRHEGPVRAEPLGLEQSLGQTRAPGRVMLQARVKTAISPYSKGASTYFCAELSCGALNLALRDADALPLARYQSLKGFAEVIGVHIRRCGGEQALVGTSLGMRLELLRQACLQEDRFFIAFHQRFCLSFLQKPRGPGIMNRRIEDRAWLLIERLLRPNAEIPRTHVEWLADFPAPIDTLLRLKVGHARALDALAVFLNRISEHWIPIWQLHRRRGFPFVVSELLVGLACPSAVLQKVFFRCSWRRVVGSLDGEEAALQIFFEDQRRHQLPFVPLGALAEWNNSIASLYQQLLAQQNTDPRPDVTPAPASSAAHATSLALASSPVFAPSGSATYQAGRPVPQAPQGQIYSGTQRSTGVAQGSMLYASPQDHLTQSPRQSPHLVQSNFSACPQPPALAGVPPNFFILPSQANTQSPQSSAMNSPQFGVAMPQGQFQQWVQNPHAYQYQMMMQQLSQQQVLQAMSQRARPQQAQMNQLLQQRMPSQPARSMQQGSIQTAVSPQIDLRFATAQQSRSPVTQAPQQAFVFQGQQVHNQQAAPAEQRPAVPILQQLLIPRVGHTPDRSTWPYDPNDQRCIEVGLHQADLRSPKRVKRREEADKTQTSGKERYYQSVQSFAVSPTQIPPRSSLYEFKFAIGEQQFKLLTRSMVPANEFLPVCEYFNGSLRYRLRTTSQSATAAASMTEAEFAASDCSWPSNIFVKLNGHPLTIRRAQHNGKDVAVELTPHLVQGDNVLRVAVPGQKFAPKINHFLAVEAVETVSHSELLLRVWCHGYHAPDVTLNEIKRRLTSSADDELSMAAEVSIDLADPFSTKVFTIPARGAACAHLECFDLDNWLITRPPAKPPRKCTHGRSLSCACSDQPLEPSHPDRWRCPICSRDARPGSLRIDGFLSGVRQQLESEGRFEGVKAVLVGSDGAWKAVMTSDDDEADGDGRRRNGTSEGPPPGPAPPQTSGQEVGCISPLRSRSVTVIDLSDDD